MPSEVNSTTKTQLALLGVLVTILIGWVLYVSASILQPLAIALLLASMLQPIVRGLARIHIPPFLTVTSLVALLFVGLAQLGIMLQVNIQAIIDGTAPPPVSLTGPEEGEEAEVPKDVGGLAGIIDSIGERMERSSIPDPVSKYIVDSMHQIDIEQLGTGLLGSGFGFMKSLLLVLLYMLFIFAEQAVFRRKILSIAADRREDAKTVLDTIGRGIQRYLGVKTLVSFATGACCYAVLVWLQIPYAPLFGFLTFLLNYIPTFGSIIAGLLPTAVALAAEPSWDKAVIVMATYVGVNVILGSIIEPRILGRELNLSPLVVIISVVVWAGLWGVVGTFLAVPLTASLQIVLASNDFTRPVAVMLSSGPPRDDPTKLKRLLKKKRSAGDTKSESATPPAGDGGESGQQETRVG